MITEKSLLKLKEADTNFGVITVNRLAKILLESNLLTPPSFINRNI